MIFGTGYSGRDIDAALKIALGQADWIGRNSNMIYALLLFAASIFLVALVHLLLERKRVGVSHLIDSTLTPTNL
jgi:hypothetical protein